CRSRKRARVKPQVRSSQLLSRDVGKCRASGGDSLCGIVAEAGVQVGTVRRPPVAVSGTVIPHAPRERFSCTERANPVNRPAAQYCRQSFVLEADWDGVGDRGNKIVSGVERGTSPVPAWVKEIHDRVGFLARFTPGESGFGVEGFGIGIKHLILQSAGSLAPQCDLHGIVVGIRVEAGHGERGKAWVDATTDNNSAGDTSSNVGR